MTIKKQWQKWIANLEAHLEAIAKWSDEREEDINAWKADVKSDLVESWERVVAAYRTVFNWRSVRVFGALQLLTRASYTMLVVVPLLAGVWPLVHWVFVEAKHGLIEHAVKLNGSAIELRASARQLRSDFQVMTGPAAVVGTNSNERISRLADGLEAGAMRAEIVAVDLTRAAAVLPDVLPSTWVYAFIAALSAVLGHFIFQSFAPQIVQRRTLEEFQATQVDEYVKTSASGVLADAENSIRMEVKRKGTWLNEKFSECIWAFYNAWINVFPVIQGGKIPHDADKLAEIAKNPHSQHIIEEARNKLNKIGNFYAYHAIRYIIDDYDVKDTLLWWRSFRHDGETPFDLNSFIWLADQHLTVPSKPKDQAERLADFKETIWIASRFKYIEESNKRTLAATTSFLLFLVTAALVIWIVIAQVYSVLSAAGWIVTSRGPVV